MKKVIYLSDSVLFVKAKIKDYKKRKDIAKAKISLKKECKKTIRELKDCVRYLTVEINGLEKCLVKEK